MASRLYQYAAILEPTENEEEQGITAKLVLPITTILAKDDSAAILLAGRDIPVEYLDKLDRIQVVVRPF